MGDGLIEKFKNPGGRPPTYPLRDLNVGDMVLIPAETPADVRRVHRNIGMYAARHGKTLRGRLDRIQGGIVVTRYA